MRSSHANGQVSGCDSVCRHPADAPFGKLYIGLGAGTHTIEISTTNGTTIALDGFRGPIKLVKAPVP